MCIEVTPLGTISPYCKESRNCPSFKITYQNQRILLDCGNGITRLLRFPEDLVNLSIFISHYHKDHFGDLAAVANAAYVYNNLGLLKEKIKVYIPKLTGYIEQEKYCGEEWMNYLSIVDMQEQYCEFIEYDDTSTFNIKDFNISFMAGIHNRVSFCTKLENQKYKLVYTGDTGYGIAKGLAKFAFGADLLIAESSLLKSDGKENKNHLHAYEAAEIAKLADVKQLLLTHFWPEHQPEEYKQEAKFIFENTEVAEEGKMLVLR